MSQDRETYRLAISVIVCGVVDAPAASASDAQLPIVVQLHGGSIRADEQKTGWTAAYAFRCAYQLTDESGDTPANPP